MSNPFDFLDSLIALENKIEELKKLGEETGLNMETELVSLKAKFEEETRRTFDKLTAWQRVQISRHPLRPQTTDYIDAIFEDFVPLAGDRAFADDEAIQCGIGRLNGTACMVIGHQKGKDVLERSKCNFGCAHPEGYRKAIRKMKLADKFGWPIITFINTPGAFPGLEAEERGQSIAIAENLRDMFDLKVPVISIVIGEGGSGGALGIGICDKLLMLENSYYSVISPEGCAAILWKDGAMAEEAAEKLKITSPALKALGIADGVILEPAGGAHSQPEQTLEAVKVAIVSSLEELSGKTHDELLDGRYDKYRVIGQYLENKAQ